MCRQRTFFATTVTAGWLRDGSQQSTLLPAVSRNGAVGFHALHRRATCANSGRSFSTAVTAGRLANVTRPERRWSGAVDRAFAGWCTGAIRCSRKPLTSSRAPTPGGVLSCVCCWKHGIGCAPPPPPQPPPPVACLSRHGVDMRLGMHVGHVCAHSRVHIRAGHAFSHGCGEGMWGMRPYARSYMHAYGHARRICEQACA